MDLNEIMNTEDLVDIEDYIHYFQSSLNLESFFSQLSLSFFGGQSIEESISIDYDYITVNNPFIFSFARFLLVILK